MIDRTQNWKYTERGKEAAAMNDVIKKLAEDLGFDSKVGELPARLVPCDATLRRFCVQNACGQYKRCWQCPPAVGAAETLIAQLHNYKDALVFTNEYPCTDYKDKEQVEKMHVAHERRSQLLWMSMQKLGYSKKNARVLTVGGCHLCPECACITGESCRHPDIACPSLSAYCVSCTELGKLTGQNFAGEHGGCVFIAIVLLK